MSKETIRVLIIEDSHDDYSLIIRKLQHGGYIVDSTLVDHPDSLREALDRQRWDVVLSDYTLPTFDALIALEIVRTYDTIVPFIIVSDTFDEEAAIRAMRAGAADFFTKHKLMLLVPAVEREITDAQHRHQRTLAEQKLRQSEERFSTAFYASPIGIVLTRLHDGRVLDVNDRFLSITGYTRDELIGKNGAEIDLWVVDSERQQLAQRITQGENIDSTEVHFRHRDGRTGIALLSTTHLQLDGEPAVMSMVYDITERKRAQQELHFQAKLLNTIGQAVIATDLDGHIVYWNRAAEDLYGWQAHEVMGADIVEIIPSDLSQEQAIEIMRQLKQDQTWQGEFSVRHKDGKIFPVLVNNTAYYDKHGQVEGIIGTSNDISQLKGVERALAESERFARATVDALTANIVIIDETGHIIAVNQPWIEYAQKNDGFDRDAYLGSNYLEVFNPAPFPEDAQRIATGIQEVVAGEKSIFSTEYSLDKMRRYWHAVTVTRFRGEGPVRVVIAYKDVTERKQATERLRLLYEISNQLTSLVVVDAQELYTIIHEQVAKHIFDVPHFVIAQYDKQTELILCEYAVVDDEVVDSSLFPARELGEGPISQAILERRIILWNPYDEIHKTEYAERHVLIGEDERISRSGIYIPLITGDKVYGVMTMQHYDADVFSEEDISLVATIASQVATTLENAHLYRTVHSYVDTLEQRVQARTLELEQAKDWVESILSSTSDVIVLVDEQGDLVQANPAFTEQFQHAPDDLIKHALTKVLASVSHADFHRALQTASAQEQAVTFDAVCIRQDHTLFETEITITPLIYQNAEQKSFVCVIYDVSHHKQIETSLRNALEKERELNELKVRFSSMVSHEFRTPLTIILSAVGMLKSYADRMSEERKATKLNDIEKQVHRLVEMLDNILTLSRAESVEISTTRKQIHLDVLCHDIVEEIKLTTDHHTLTFTSVGDVRPITLDPNLIGEVLRNLLTNAVKYSPNGGCIRLKCQYKDKELALIVSDEGLGIPEEDQVRLFEAFHRAKNVQDISGTGLGLAIVQRGVQAHDGKITIESKLGVGSIFRITLPIV
ncbi:MAG: PAS domain S-box protein [Anaerolineae bacterium]